jgi:succinate dehydrogenase flavin-adding protein (antitoxin of CptAB toxin-antitoxin module)
MSSDEKKKHLAITARQINAYVDNLQQWTAISDKAKPIFNTILQLRDTEITFARQTCQHGYVFVGAFMKRRGAEFVRTVLMAFNERGERLERDTREIVQAFKDIPQSEFTETALTQRETEIIGICIDKIAPFMAAEYAEECNPVIEQNDKRIKNWLDNQRGQYKAESDDLRQQVSELTAQMNASKLFQEKIDIKKKIDKLERQLKLRDENFHLSMTGIERQAEKASSDFNAQFAFEPIVLINLVVKF